MADATSGRKQTNTPTIAVIEVEAYRERGPGTSFEQWTALGFLTDEVLVDAQDIFLIEPSLDQFMASRGYTGTIAEAQLADFFISEAQDRVRYDHTVGAWFLWDESHWRQDGRRVAFESIRRLNMAASERLSPSKKEKACRAAFAAGVEKFATVDQRVSTTADLWNPNIDLLGTPGGTVDLRSSHAAISPVLHRVSNGLR